MAITNLTIIEDALREINVLNEVQSATAEQGTQGLRKLNQMAEMWKEDSLDVGWFRQSDTTADAPIPDYAEQPMTYGLAVMMAPKYGASISPELATVIGYSISTLRRKLIKEALDNVDMTHLPEGTGHWGHRYNIQTDF